MHASLFNALKALHAQHQAAVAPLAVAELGSLDINGSIRDFIPDLTGFDIVAGPGVDVVIQPGAIPPEHQRRYGLVVSTSSFQFCPRPDLYKRQILDLLGAQGHLFLTMCSDRCQQRHSTSNNEQGFGDSFRMSLAQLRAFFDDAFDCLSIEELVSATVHPHLDFVYVGRRKAGAAA